MIVLKKMFVSHTDPVTYHADWIDESVNSLIGQNIHIKWSGRYVCKSRLEKMLDDYLMDNHPRVLETIETMK